MQLLIHRNFKVLASDGLVASGEGARLAADGQFKTKMKRILDMASEMVSTTCWALSGFDTACRLNLSGAANDPDVKVVVPALLKYFRINIDFADQTAVRKHLSRVDRIRMVYQTISTGLTLRECNIIIETMAATTKARVALEQKMRDGASPIRRAFGFTDEFGHKQWQMSIGDIELNLSYVNGEPPDTVARTVVHEGSHKFANTKDVLYKDGSFAKLPSDQFEEAKQYGIIGANDQPEFTLPGRTKKLRPMAGTEKGTENVITDERWLENADSYAWAARRIWKHKTNFRRAA